MKEKRFKAGERVKINPLATEKDFEKNNCTDSFMSRLDEEFIIERVNYDAYHAINTYHIEDWWIQEKCLIPTREVNEI